MNGLFCREYSRCQRYGNSFFLDQSEAKGVTQNGSAARFDDVGLYLFDTKKMPNLVNSKRSEVARLHQLDDKMTPKTSTTGANRQCRYFPVNAQTKFAASFGSPEPLYFATFG
jgi:hypothetical protein